MFSKKEIKQIKSILGEKTKAPPKKTKTRRNKRKAKVGNGEVFRITRKVLLFETGGAAKEGYFEWRAQNITVLSAYLALFQSYRLVGPVKINYVPGCSNQENGTLMVGYSSIAAVKGRDKIANLAPLLDTSIWQKASMNIPSIIAREGNPSFHGKADSLFYLNWAQNSTQGTAGFAAGEVWATFSVEFISPFI